MKPQEQINFNRIAQAIEYLTQNFKEQPALETVAAHIHLSPFHFQRLFTNWAGVSPKKFLQFLTVDHAKQILQHGSASLLEVAYDAGLSGTGRLHDLFLQIEGMTPGEYKNGGAELSINYSFAESPFGKILVASTFKGICHMSFIEEEPEAVKRLQHQFPNALLQPLMDVNQQNALHIFNNDWNQIDRVKLHLKGTAFQLKVWEALLKIPPGRLTTYTAIAKRINHPKALRAVGAAIGHNPVAFLIPCHRVIQAAGTFGNYHWGPVRKQAMIGWEAARAYALQ